MATAVSPQDTWHNYFDPHKEALCAGRNDLNGGGAQMKPGPWDELGRTGNVARKIEAYFKPAGPS
jgi:hypothetical protein